MIIVSPFYNAGESLKKCIDSLKMQTHNDFRAYFIDDMSTDNSKEIFYENTKDDQRFNLIVNTEKKFALKNIYDCLSNLSLDNEDIIIQLDGDDWLPNETTLELVNNTYVKEGCWLTYGSYIDLTPNVRGACCQRVPDIIIDRNAIREYGWVTSHLKTFKYGLYNKIRVESFLDMNNNWFTTTHDLALMFPMIEMAGYRSRFIEEITYIYNDSNELNDHKVFRDNVINNAEYIRRMTRYQKIESL